VNLSFPRHTHRQTHRQTDTQTDRHTHRHLSDCSSSLASAEIEILIRMGYQSRFVRSGKIGWARLTDISLRPKVGFVHPRGTIAK
jgi:fatty-acid desaturase